MRVTRTILLIGGSSTLGTHLAMTLREGFKVFTTHNLNPLFIRGITSLNMDVTSRNSVKRVVYAVSPDIVIYCAGNNDLESTQKNPKNTEAIHLSGPATVAAFSGIFQARMIYISNGYIFDGNKGNYHETDIVMPSTPLGKAKVGGENTLKGKSLNYQICRVSPFLGRGNGTRYSLLDEMRIHLSRGKSIELSQDEIHSFVPVSALTEMILKMIESNHRNRIFHFGGLTKMSYFELGLEFARRFRFPEKLISPKPKTRSQPADFSLNMTATIDLLKLKPLLIEECFDLIEKDLVPKS